MNPKHLAVVNAYMKHGSKEQALLDAGFSSSYSRSIGLSKVFDREDVKNEIEKRQERMRERSAITEDWIIERLVDIADADVGSLFDTCPDTGKKFINYEKLSPSLRRAIMIVDVDEQMEGRGEAARPKQKIKIRMNDKLRALEMLGKILGMFTEKVEVTGEASLIEKINKGRFRAASDGDTA